MPLLFAYAVNRFSHDEARFKRPFAFRLGFGECHISKNSLYSTCRFDFISGLYEPAHESGHEITVLIT